MAFGELHYYDCIHIFKPIFGNYKNYVRYCIAKSENDLIRYLDSLG